VTVHVGGPTGTIEVGPIAVGAGVLGPGFGVLGAGAGVLGRVLRVLGAGAWVFVEADGVPGASGVAVTVVLTVTILPGSPGIVDVSVTTVVPGSGVPEAEAGGAADDGEVGKAAVIGEDRGDSAAAGLAEMLWEHAASDPTMTTRTGRVARLMLTLR
jgi:hypothetical protein